MHYIVFFHRALSFLTNYKSKVLVVMKPRQKHTNKDCEITTEIHPQRRILLMFEQNICVRNFTPGQKSLTVTPKINSRQHYST